MHPKLEQRELKSSDSEVSAESSEDSDDEKELIALKMAADNDVSQDEILAIIRSNQAKAGAVKKSNNTNLALLFEVKE